MNTDIENLANEVVALESELRSKRANLLQLQMEKLIEEGSAKRCEICGEPFRITPFTLDQSICLFCKMKRIAKRDRHLLRKFLYGSLIIDFKAGGNYSSVAELTIVNSNNRFFKLYLIERKGRTDMAHPSKGDYFLNLKEVKGE